MAKLLFDIQTGVSGDMILGALFDLGLDFKAWSAAMARLKLKGVKPSVASVRKGPFRARHFRVALPHEHAHRGLADITRIIRAAKLEPSVSGPALQVFRRIAEVEAAIHGTTVDKVHFHELGALDTIVDVVGACQGLHMLGVDACYTTPFTFGAGTVDTAHGRMPVPVPATLALSRGFPVRYTGIPGELCTPTGTALVTHFARPLPPDLGLTVARIGYGAGTRDLPGMANVLRLCLLAGGEGEGAGDGDKSKSLTGAHQIECNLDNMAPELLGHVAGRLLAAGCLDVWQEPIHMKKSRSAVKLGVLVDDAGLEPAIALILGETAAGGLRHFPVRRRVGLKASATVPTAFGRVAVKGVAFPDLGVERWRPEYESCRAAAERKGAPLREVYAAAERALSGRPPAFPAPARARRGNR